MKECDRCGFLNPDKAEYCIKCRFHITEGQEVPSPEIGGSGPGGLPSSYGEKPDIIAPAPDLDDTFSGRGQFDVGGYQAGGVAPGDVYGPPPSDAYALMTGAGERGPGKKQVKRRGRKRPKKRKAKTPTPRAAPMGAARGKVRQGLPPPMSAPGAPGDVYRRAQAGTGKAIPSRPRRSLPRPNLEVLAGIGELATPRNVMTAIVGVLLLLTFIYMVAGGGYFSRQESGLLDSSAAAMGSLESVHLRADLLINSEKKGSITRSVTVDAKKNGDLRATCVSDGPDGPMTTHYLRVNGLAYESGDGVTWEEARDVEVLDYSSGFIFRGASGVKQVNKEPIDGVECDHLAFSGGGAFPEGLIPGAEATATTRVNTEVWIDPKDNYVRHVRLDARDLEVRGLGRCDCHLEAGFSNFGAPLDIQPPG